MKYILLITSMLLGSPSFSMDFLHTYQPYFGLDGQWHAMNNGNTSGSNVLPTVNPVPPASVPTPVTTATAAPVLPHYSNTTHYGAPALNLYTGAKFDKCWGIETGYSINYSKTYHTYRFTRQSLHMCLMMFMPINTSIELIGGFGCTSLRHVVAPLNKGCLIHIKERSSLTKLTPRAVAGIQLYTYEKLSIRLSVTWENSKKMRIRGFNFHDSLHYGIGLQHKL